MSLINLYRWFADPFNLSVAYPILLLLLPVIIFGYLYLKTKKIFIGITSLLWLVFILYEGLFVSLSKCPSPCNPIRVDLGLIVPLLFGSAIVSSVMYLQQSFPQIKKLPRSTKVLLIETAIAFL